MPISLSVDLKASIIFLRKHSEFAPLIAKHGVPDFERTKNAFQSLVRSIVYQQLSGKAAETIFQRFLALFPKGKFPTPQQVLDMPFEKMRSVGLSTQKATYVHALAAKFADGTIKAKSLDTLTSEELAKVLIQVKGVGQWTVDMFLIFALNRLDILPLGDLGIQKGFQKLYGLKALPKAGEMQKLAEHWKDHASVASWYLWRLADEGNTNRPIKKEKSVKAVEKVSVLKPNNKKTA